MKNIVLGILAVVVVAGGIWYFTSKRPLPPSVDAGVPIYPGAKNANADTFSARLSPRDRAKLVKVVIYETDDPPEKVMSFYREKLSGKSEVVETRRRGVPAGVFRAEIDGTPKLIMVTTNEDTNKTEISIGNIEQKK